MNGHRGLRHGPLLYALILIPGPYINTPAESPKQLALAIGPACWAGACDAYAYALANSRTYTCDALATSRTRLMKTRYYSITRALPVPPVATVPDSGEVKRFGSRDPWPGDLDIWFSRLQGPVCAEYVRAAERADLGLPCPGSAR